MPFAKGVVRVSGGKRTTLPGAAAAADAVFGKPRSCDEVFHESLVDASRQLTVLLLLAGQLFDELIADCRLIGDRTDCLRRRVEGVTDAVGRLDAKSASIPEGSIHAVVQVARHFEADYAYRNLLTFDPSSRPFSVQELYSGTDPTPVEHIRELDCYRTDGVRGAQIFSRNPVAINKWADDFCPAGNIQAKYMVTPSPKTRKIRPLQTTTATETMTDNNSQRNSAEVGDGRSVKKKIDDLDEVFAREEEYFPASSDLQAVLVAEVDVTGASFSKLCELHARSHTFEIKEDSHSTASLGRYKKTTIRPKTITGISDLVFQEVDVDLPSPKHCSSAKVKGIHRRSLKKLNSQTLEIYAPKETGKSQKKRVSSRCSEEDDSKLCSSFRHSLKSVFRLSRSKSKDLWNPTAAVEETSNKSEKDFFALRRSLSLPRSLKSSAKPLSFGSFRSSSVEGHLNHRILSAEQMSADKSASSSRLRKPLVAERRSLTKSLSQIRLGRSSKSKKSFGRPQSMEIRMPQLDEGGRSMLSLFNSSAINMSSTATVAGVNNKAHPWMKSLSNVKLRNTENKNNGYEYQSSSGQWSGSSSFTEKQLHDSGRHSSGSVLVVQSSSDTSFSTKDSAMCLHFNPGERDSLAQNQKICPETSSSQNTGLLQTTVVCQNENHSSVAEQQVVKSSPNILQCKRISDSLVSRTHHRRDTDDENCRSSLPADNSTSHFSRAAKSSPSAKPKSSYRSSFMLKLKKLAKPNKLEASVTSPSVSPSSISKKTMGDCISVSNEAQSLTPRLPRAQFEELRKLSELAERMASYRAMSKVPTALCGPLSGQDCGVQRDKLLDCHLIPFGEVHKNLHSDALNLLSFEESVHNSQNIPGTASYPSSNTGPSVSMCKLDQRTAAKGQKLNELESILETSHDCESLSPSAVRSKQPSLGKFCAKIPKQLSLSAVRNSTEIICPTVSPYSEDLDIANRSEEKDKRPIGSDAGEGSFSEISASKSSVLSALPLSISSKDVVIACQFDPSPATARLIISSPMVDRAFYIDNPHKRLLCQALPHDEFAKFFAVDAKAGQSLSKNKSRFVYPEISSVSKQSLDFLKRSSWSSFIIGECVDLSNYSQLCYDGIAEPHPDQADIPLHSSPLPFASSVEFSKEIGNTSSRNSNMESNALKQQNSCTTRTEEDQRLHSTSACSNVLMNRLNDSTVATCSVKSASDRKCARVVFPSTETGPMSHQPFARHSALKHNVGSQKPFTSVNILKLDTFAGNTLGNYAPETTRMYHLSNGGGTLNLKRSFISNDAELFRSSTLPRSYPSAPGERRSLALSSQH